MERWELEGKPTYRNPQNANGRGFRRPNNNGPHAFPREQREKCREDKRIQTPLQNNTITHEGGEEIDEFDPKIHSVEEAPPFPHLTQSAYEKSLMNIQIHELGKGERVGHTSNRYNLRQGRKKETSTAQTSPS